MVRDMPQKISPKVILALLISGFLGAVGAHLWDILEVKTKVDSINKAQDEEHKYHLETVAKLYDIDQNYDTVIKAQWVMNKRLCGYLIEHGAGDAECNQQMWEEHIQDMDRERKLAEAKKKARKEKRSGH